MSLPIAQIDAFLRANNVYDSIRKVLGEQKLGPEAVSQLQESGVIDEALHHLSLAKKAGKKILPGKRYLHMRVNPGKAFVDHLVDDELKATPSTLTLVIQFGIHTYRTRPVASTVEPEFKQSFIIPLQKEKNDNPMISLNKLIQKKTPIHLMLLREKPDGRVSIVATHNLEWRKVLVHGRISLNVELMHGVDVAMPVGLLDLDLEILPLKMPPSSDKLPVFIEQSTITKQLNREKELALDIERRFHAYAKAWWEDYQQIRPSHQARLIKLFAIGDDGKRHFACSFLQPLYTERCLDSCFHAARFVRVIPYQRDVKLGGEKNEIWHSPHVLLGKRWGDVEDHALLLCSLFLGFGLDAYVCIGTDGKGAHMWVMTLSETYKVTFWESLTGQRFELPRVDSRSGVRPSTNIPYHSIHAVFNHRSFYANTQIDDSVNVTRFVLSNKGCWKAMNEQAIACLPKPAAITIPASTFDPAYQEEQIEQKLQALISHFRKNTHQLTSHFDRTFSYTLGPALSSYESERCTGVCYGNDEFAQSIRQSVPNDYVFKGVPLQFSHVNPRSMFQTMLENKAMLDLLSSRGEDMTFALRAKAVVYPANFCSVWIMVACRYRDATM